MVQSKNKPTETWRHSVAGVGVTVLLGLGFLIFSDALTNLSFDVPLALRAPIKTDDVLIVYMDEESHRRLGQQPRFDKWNRSLHAQLIVKLRANGAKAVVFDVLFDETNNPASDRALVEAARTNGNVAVAAIVAPLIQNRRLIGYEPVRPFDELRDAVGAWGMVEVSDGESVIRKHYQGDLNVPGLNWQVAEMTLAHPPDPAKPRWINYYGPPGTIPWESYHRVISNAVPMEAASNKVVYVGALFSVGFTGGRGTDDYRTPHTLWPPHKRAAGVEINATTYLNLKRGDWLNRPLPAVECAIVALAGALSALGLMQLRPVAAAGIGAAVSVLVGVAACLVVWTFKVWFPWLIVAVVQIPCAAACSVLINTQRLQREKEHLREALAAVTPESAATPLIPAPGSPSGDPSELATSYVLDEMKRLRGTSGMSPGPSAPPVVPKPVPPAVPDHELLRCIGQGGYGEVWLARSVLGRFRAAKIVYWKTFKDARPYEREFEGLSRFEPISRSHPGLVQILHIGRDDSAGYYYYLMEAADDEETGQEIDPAKYSPKTLAGILARRGQLPLDECLRLAESMITALDYLHSRGLIHRDIKPSNIIFVNGEPKFADIGLVTDIGEDKTFVGTAGYLPPEGPGTPSADLYSLGKVLYELSTGFDRRRFPELPTSFNEQDWSKGLSALNDLILKACDVDPRRRYASAKEMRRDLEKVGQGT